MTRRTLPIAELREGDQFIHEGKLHYTVTGPAERAKPAHEMGDVWWLKVEFADGGHGIRVFDLDQTLRVTRQ